MNLEFIGLKIRKYRNLRNLRQEDLAEMTDLSVNYIGMIERGEKVPSLDTFIKILNALDVSADLVLCDVLNVGYTIKTSVLSEKIEKLNKDDRDKLFEIIEVMLKHSK